MSWIWWRKIRGGVNRVINREARLFINPWRYGGWWTVWLRGKGCSGVTYLGGIWFTGGEGRTEVFGDENKIDVGGKLCRREADREWCMGWNWGDGKRGGQEVAQRLTAFD